MMIFKVPCRARDGSLKFVEVSAVPEKLEGIDYVDVLIHHSINRDLEFTKEWTATELRSLYSIVDDCRTKQIAREKAANILARVGKDKVLDDIQNAENLKILQEKNENNFQR